MTLGTGGNTVHLSVFRREPKAIMNYSSPNTTTLLFGPFNDENCVTQPGVSVKRGVGVGVGVGVHCSFVSFSVLCFG